MNTFDPRLLVRTAILGGIAGYYGSRGMALSPELAAGIGAVVMGLYDVIAFHVKARSAAND